MIYEQTQLTSQLKPLLATRLETWMFTLKHHLCSPHANNFDTILSLDNLTIMGIGMKSSSRTVERFISKSGHLERGEHGEWAWQLKRAHNSRLMTKSSRSQESWAHWPRAPSVETNYFRIFPWLNLRPSKSVPCKDNNMWGLRYTIRNNLKNIYCKVFWSLKPLYRQEAECNRTICHPWVGQRGIKWPKRHPWGELLDLYWATLKGLPPTSSTGWWASWSPQTWGQASSSHSFQNQ